MKGETGTTVTFEIDTTMVQTMLWWRELAHRHIREHPDERLVQDMAPDDYSTHTRLLHVQHRLLDKIEGRTIEEPIF